MPEWACRCLAFHPRFTHNARTGYTGTLYGDLIGPPAMLVCSPGQVRKEAAKADNVCAGMSAGEVATKKIPYFIYSLIVFLK